MVMPQSWCHLERPDVRGPLEIRADKSNDFCHWQLARAKEEERTSAASDARNRRKGPFPSDTVPFLYQADP